MTTSAQPQPKLQVNLTVWPIRKKWFVAGTCGIAGGDYCSPGAFDARSMA